MVGRLAAAYLGVVLFVFAVGYAALSARLFQRSQLELLELGARAAQERAR